MNEYLLYFNQGVNDDSVSRAIDFLQFKVYSRIQWDCHMYNCMVLQRERFKIVNGTMTETDLNYHPLFV
jgi:hypothetical protein